MVLVSKLEKINLLRKQLDDLYPMSREAEDKLWQKFRLEWSFNSNRIEGNTLTYGETQLLLIFGKTTGDHELREYEEMSAHDVAINAIKEWAHDKTRELNEADVRSLNEIILVRSYWQNAITYDGQATRRQIKIGDYKDHPNSVRLKTGEIFHYTSPAETPKLMHELMDWYKKNVAEHPLILASELHYRFIRIHPFDDGNGRVARLLVNYVLMKAGYPPVIIKSVDKETYLTALQKADSGDREAFHGYMAEQLIWSLEIAVRAVKGESIEDPDDVDKEVAVWKKRFKKESADDPHEFNLQIYELYKNSIRPLLELYVEKMKQFDELFAVKEIKGWVNGGRNQLLQKDSVKYVWNLKEDRGLDSIDNSLERIIKFENPFFNLEKSNVRTAAIERDDLYNSMSIEVHWEIFEKDGANDFDQLNEICIKFLPTVYQIKWNSTLVKEYSYADYISAEEAKTLVSYCVKKTLEEIKSKIKSNT